MKYKTYKNENERVSIWNSGHEARVTAGPLHYLLLKGVRDIRARTPAISGCGIHGERAAQHTTLEPPAVWQSLEVDVRPPRRLCHVQSHHLDHDASAGGGGRETRPERSVVCAGGTYSTRGFARTGGGDGERGRWGDEQTVRIRMARVGGAPGEVRTGVDLRAREEDEEGEESGDDVGKHGGWWA